MISDQLEKDLKAITDELAQQNPDLLKKWAQDVMGDAWQRGYTQGYLKGQQHEY